MSVLRSAHRRAPRVLLALTTLTALAAGCAGPADDADPIDIGVADVPSTDLGLPSDTAADTGSADTSAADTTSSDIAAGDTASDTAVDASTADTGGDECPGAPGCHCKGNDDCDNGLCTEDPTSDSPFGKVCATTCVDSCSKGYSCVQIQGAGGDPVSLCVPSWGRVCNPCTTSKECAFPGLLGGACVDQGALGAFCGAACSADTDCDAGYQCKDVTSVEGAKSKQCVRKADAGASAPYGVCPCSPAATKAKLSTVCKVEKKDSTGAVVASCSGTRSCLATGLGACVAPAASPEVCDGVDNDCNGETDEATCDDKSSCTTDACDPKAAKCVHTPMQDGVGCDADGSVCTENDTCKGGACVAGPVKVCDDKNPCTKDACDMATGCTQTASDGTPCDDDNPCTLGDVCKAKSCVPGAPKKCSSGDPCVLASCSLSKGGKCDYKDAIDGLPCDDGNACTEKDACKSGSCTAGGVATCDDKNPCTDDTCDQAGGCKHTQNTKPCDADGDACTEGEQCAGGKCTGGKLKTCDDDNACTVDSCDKATGKCVYNGGAATGKACDDGNVCTESDGCKEGSCQGSAKSCDDGNPCTVNTCKAGEQGGCVATAKSGACDDGNPCTKSDACAKGKCAGVGKSCDDGNPCTKDACDAKQDCTHTPVTGPCTDGDACTEKDACTAGKCVGSAATCDDGNPCTDDSCNKNSGCLFTANTKPCADSDPCTVSETCSNKTCTKQAKICDDGNPCTQDSCDPKSGCVAKNVSAVCDDGDKCTDKDSCAAGKCAGVKVSCDDGNSCTVDSCASKSGCTTSPAKDESSCGGDGTKWCKAGTCVVKQNPNKAPVAKLSCPSSAQVGQSLSFDGSGSSDADGKIVNYAFSFGDGSGGKSGAANTASHAFAKAGTFKTLLLVTDDKGASGSASCSVTVSAATPPKVVFIKPTTDFAATQGQNVPVTVDVTPPPGKSITKVELVVAGKVVLTDTSLPYSMTWVVPASAKTGSKLALYARAIDSSGTPGASKILQVTVKNDKPVAKFTATVVGKLKVAVDGSLSTDTETPTSKLLVRYDWTNDGTFDTAWSTSKKLEKSYAKDGTYTIKMQVKDEDGQVSEATRKVSMSSITQVGGTISTTTWSGTVIITGDIIVPKGQVLTISEGTSVLFVPVDQDKNGVGDFDIWVYGKLKVLGSAQAPVTISTYGSKKTAGKDWGRIQLKGEGSTLSNAVIEYGYVGLDALDTSTVSHVTVRNSATGVSVGSGSNLKVNDLTASNNLANGVAVVGSGKVALDGVTLTSNGQSGLRANTSSTAASVSVKDALVTGNKQHGIWVRSTASSMVFHFSESKVESNGQVGVYLVGGMKGAVTRNKIQFNQHEGLRVAPYLTYDVQTTVHTNNISGNALSGAWSYQALSLSAKRSGYGSGSATSPAWTVPDSSTAALVRATYSEKDYANKYVQGRVRKDSSSGTVMTTTTGPLSLRWLDVSAYKAKKLVAQAYKSTSSSSYYGTMSVLGAVWFKPGLKREVTVITHSKTLDARHNYLGTFPDVLKVVTRSSSTAVNLHGFMGKPYDSKWLKGPYWGGTTLSGDVSWSGQVWVTGDLTVPAGKTLTVAAGTQVHMVRYDANSNGVGDFRVTVLGALKLNGTAGSKVTVSTWGATKTAGKDWDRVYLKGSGSVVQHALIAYGAYGLEIADSTPVSHTTLDKNGYGAAVRSGANTKLDTVSVTGSLYDGLYVSAAGKVAADKSSFTGNARAGVRVSSSATSTSVALKNSVLSNNQGAGLDVVSSTSGMLVSVFGCNIKSNGHAGVALRGGMTGSLNHNNVLYNGYEGVRVSPYKTTDVQAKITYNNLFGNGLKGAWVHKVVNLSVKRSGYGSGAATSAAYSTPKGESIELMRVGYSEKDYANKYVEGRVRKDSSSGAVLLTTTGPLSPSWYSLGAGTKKLVAQAYKSSSSSSYYGTASVYAVVYTQAGLKRELAVVSSSKSVDLRHNYYGTFPDVLKVVTLSGSTAANLHGFVGKAFDASWKTGPYWGGESVNANVSWSGEVWVTGDLSIPAGKSLTVAPGTKVHMVRYDVAKDGTGDFDITVAGAFTVSGTQSSPVVFDELGGNKAKGSWNQILVGGTSSAAKVSHAVFDHGHNGLVLGSGKHSVNDVITRNHAGYGLVISGANAVAVKQLSALSNGASGVYVNSASGVAIDRLVASGNAAHGVRFNSSKSAVSVKNLSAKNNLGAGVYSDNASPVVSQCALTGNQVGVWIRSSSGGSVSKCDIKANKAEGVLLTSVSGKHPNPVVNDNNIFGNGTVEGMVKGSASLSIKRSGYGSGAATSAAWTSPYYDSSKKTRARIWALRYGYSEKDYANKYVQGRLRKDSSSGTILLTTTGPLSSRWQPVWGSNISKFVLQVHKSSSSSSYYGTATVSGAFYRLAATQVELAAITDSGTVNCKNNYWGSVTGFDSRIVLSRTNAVDYSGFSVLEKNVGPQ